MSNPLLVGVDVNRKTNIVCLMDRQGKRGGPPLHFGGLPVGDRHKAYS